MPSDVPYEDREEDRLVNFQGHPNRFDWERSVNRQSTRHIREQQRTGVESTQLQQEGSPAQGDDRDADVPDPHRGKQRSDRYLPRNEVHGSEGQVAGRCDCGEGRRKEAPPSARCEPLRLLLERQICAPAR